jgi:hypothetical protein
LTILRTSSVKLGLSVDALMSSAGDYVYTSIVSIGIAVSATRQSTISRSATVVTGIKGMAGRSVQSARASAVKVGIAVSATLSQFLYTASITLKTFARAVTGTGKDRSVSSATGDRSAITK